uniref:Phosphatase tensin-type domain-containing protein n=1 Tax=Parascaris equorum TaxID=6256 RepID=A0A914S300_PAREQ
MRFDRGFLAAALFPSDGTDAQYRTGLKDATVLLRRNHPERYKVFNVSKKRSDLGRLHPVVELGWPQELAPPLDRLCSICKMFENWLAANKENVVVVHCKGGCSRAAIVKMSHNCSDESVADRFAMQRFSERFLGVDGQPSHKRYVNYFASLLSGRTKISPSTIYFHQIALCNFSSRNILFKIYERMQPVHTTQLTLVTLTDIF